MKDIITSPIFYMGNKKKLINKGLIDLFPKDIDMFVDLFAGSGVVSMNVDANKYVVNDFNIKVYEFYKMFKNNISKIITKQILYNIQKFDLPRTGVKQHSEFSEKYKEHYFLLRKYCNETKDILDLYSCMFYAFSQQMRFNNSHQYNSRFGKEASTMNNNIRNNVNIVVDLIHNNNYQFVNKDFRELKIDKLTSSDFVYCDPDFVEIHGSMSGDDLVFRVYKNGMVTER